MIKNIFISFILLLTLPFTLSAQMRTITGKVLDGDFDNTPLIGATVKVVNDDESAPVLGTATDIDGKFTLDVPTVATELSVTFIGYETEFVKLVPEKSEYTVVLRSNSNKINEVVITGYQNIERRRLTSAVKS